MVALLDCLLISLQLILAGAWAAPEPAAAAPAAAARELAELEELEDASLPPQRVLAAARELMKQVPASATGRGLPLDPAGRRRLLAGLGRAVLAAGGDGAGGAGAPALAGQLAEYLGAWARGRGLALGRRGGWTATEVAELAAEDLVDPARFDDDAAFRRWVLELLPGEP